MLLYHGSYTVIKRPRLLKNQRMHDFGDGFYLTTDKEQAKSGQELFTIEFKKRN